MSEESKTLRAEGAKPRTWRIQPEPALTPFWVIELEPVLDLLELALIDIPDAESGYYVEGELRDQIEALLREHGRLK